MMRMRGVHLSFGNANRALVLIGTAAITSVTSAETSTPTNVPKLFGEGVISGPANELSPAFSPDGQTVYFARSNGSERAILVSHKVGITWADPEIAPFSGEWGDIEPAMSPDGSYLIFASNRPAAQTGKPLDGRWGGKPMIGRGGNLWRVNRVGKGWGRPFRLPNVINRSGNVFSPSITQDGVLYFMDVDENGEHFQVFRSLYGNGEYQAATLAGLHAGTRGSYDPAVAPDESFIVFSTNSQSHPNQSRLFIAFGSSGHWDEPIDLGDDINREGDNTEARLGADHRTLYFSTNRVEPVSYPTTRAQAAKALRRMLVRDNGNQNIWYVSLAPWLDTQHLSR